MKPYMTHSRQNDDDEVYPPQRALILIYYIINLTTSSTPLSPYNTHLKYIDSCFLVALCSSEFVVKRRKNCSDSQGLFLKCLVSLIRQLNLYYRTYGCLGGLARGVRKRGGGFVRVSSGPRSIITPSRCFTGSNSSLLVAMAYFSFPAFPLCDESDISLCHYFVVAAASSAAPHSSFTHCFFLRKAAVSALKFSISFRRCCSASCPSH
jgi:hypothetical protein